MSCHRPGAVRLSACLARLIPIRDLLSHEGERGGGLLAATGQEEVAPNSRSGSISAASSVEISAESDPSKWIRVFRCGAEFDVISPIVLPIARLTRRRRHSKCSSSSSS